MPGVEKDIFTNSTNTRGSPFRLKHTRQVDLSLRQELNDVKLRSIEDIIARKGAEKQISPTEEEKLAKQLKPEFIPEKKREQRKLHPIFHDGVASKKQVEKLLVPLGLSVYNPLDRKPPSTTPRRSNRYPYIKEKTVTTEEMKKPRTTSLGVVPTRASKDISSLNVFLEGKHAGNKIDTTLEEMEQANKVSTPPVSRSRSENYDESIADPVAMRIPTAPSQAKPALLSVTGNIQTVKFSERNKPPARPSYLDVRRQRRIKSGRSTASSLRSEEIYLSDDVYQKGKYDEAIRDMDADLETAVGAAEDGGPSNSTSAGSVKSLKELVEEAKQIVSPAAEPVPKQPQLSSSRKSPRKSPHKSPRRKKTKKDSRESKGMVNEDGEEDEVRTERTVDQIIASLRNQSQSRIITKTDREIQEIMDGVMSRASAVLDNYDDQRSQDEVTPIGGRTPDKDNAATEYIMGYIDSPLGFHDDKSPEDNLQSSGKVEDKSECDASTSRTDDLSMFTEEVNTPSLAVTSSLARKTEESETEKEAVIESHEDKVDDETEDRRQDVDLQMTWEEMKLPLIATYEDVVSVHGQKKSLEARVEPMPNTSERIPVYSTSVSFLSTWAPSSDTDKMKKQAVETTPRTPKHIHHFCTVTSEFQLPKQFQNIGRKYHTPDRLKGVYPEQPYRFDRHNLAQMVNQMIPESPEVSTTLEERTEAAAKRIFMEATAGDKTDDSFEAWQRRAESLFAQPSEDLVVDGCKAHINFDESRVYWNPAPPKLDVPPARVREVLFAEYKVPVQGGELGEETVMSDSDSDSEGEDQVDWMCPEDREMYNRIMARKHKSVEDLTNLKKSQMVYNEKVAEGRVNPYTGDIIVLQADEDADGQPETSEVIYSNSSGLLYTKDTSFLPSYLKNKDKIFPVFPLLRKSKSQPNLCPDDDTLLVPLDFNTAMEEIQEQKAQIKEIRLRKSRGDPEPPAILKRLSIAVTEKDDEDIQDDYVEEAETELSSNLFPSKDTPLTPAELALEAGRNYVLLPKKKKKKIEVAVDEKRVEAIHNFLNQKPNKLIRSASFSYFPHVIERELRVPQHVRSTIRNSRPNLLDFEEFKVKGEMKGDEDEREWTRDVWNAWFDELYPPTPSGSEDEEEKAPQLAKLTLLKPKVKEVKRAPSVQSVLSDIDTLEPVEDTEENAEILQILRDEIEKICNLLENNEKGTAFNLCRRGALYRKIGQLKRAADDLNKAIEMEPLLLDAYWHRHLLYILQDKKQAALDDLQFIMKKNKQHGGAYRSMAEIYRKQGDVTMAIVNYTQAIKCNPQDHEAYFQRAEMYEQRGEVLLALEDYAQTKKIMPTRTDAIMKHGRYYFDHECDDEARFSKNGKHYIPMNFAIVRRNPNWNNAINDFTDLLKVDPSNAEARLYRGRAYSKLGHWVLAVEDLSAAIHLDPNNWQAFYHRACIIRKSCPERALQDYSMSLLLEDSEDNLMSFLHRGILYNDLDCPEDAVADFESVLALNKDVACAHVCIGLIQMNKFNNPHRAIKKFQAAIKVDPTYLRAYICRGEAFHKIHELTSAIRDFSRAIHLRPDIQHYYMYRGQLILETGNLELAAFCVRQASELNVDTSSSSLGERPTQQAIVQSFLKNYDKAIEALVSATKVVRDGDKKPVGPLYMLLGKTQMKAKRYKDAVNSFTEALARFKPWKPREPWPVEASEAFYLSGVCHMELRNFQNAVESFNSAIKLDSQFAAAFYQRGLARMKLKQSKGVQDFNRALAINPKIFQAYLSRACYYGMKKNYTKAILNCNEALKLQPNSVRAYLYRGALKYHIKVYDLAIRDLSKAASIDNTCSLAYFNRAVCYQESKKFDMALMDYGIVLLLGDQLFLKVFINRGLLYFERKDYANALYDFQMSVKLSPSDHRIRHTLGLCYHKMDRLPEAVQTFTDCLKIKPFFLEALIARGNVYMDYGNHDGLVFARRDYQRVLRLDPMCLAARVNLAYTLQVEGHLMQAWTQFTAAIEVKPTFKPALEGRGIISLQMSSTFAASQDITASINVSPTAELLTNRGVIHQFNKDVVNAMKDYQLAIKLDPTYSLAYFNMANVNFHTRHFKQALHNYNKALECNSKDESAFLNRAITKVLLRDAPGALSDFKSAIKLSPHSAHMYFNRGNLYSSLQQYDKAEKDYSKALELVPDDALTLKRRADVRGKLGRREEAVIDYKRAVDIQGRPRRTM